MIEYTTFKEAIAKAKLKVVKEYEHKDTTDRAWLEAHVDSYEAESSRLTMLVLEGSPVKGFIMVNYGTHSLTAFGAWGNRLYTWRNLYRETNRSGVKKVEG